MTWSGASASAVTALFKCCWRRISPDSPGPLRLLQSVLEQRRPGVIATVIGASTGSFGERLLLMPGRHPRKYAHQCRAFGASRERRAGRAGGPEVGTHAPMHRRTAEASLSFWKSFCRPCRWSSSAQAMTPCRWCASPKSLAGTSLSPTFARRRPARSGSRWPIKFSLARWKPSAWKLALTPALGPS